MGVTVAFGLGSTHTNPNQFLLVHVVLSPVSVGVGAAVLVYVGGSVIGASADEGMEVVVGVSLHPHHPGVRQVVDVGSCVFVFVVEVVVVTGAVVCGLLVEVVVLSLHPNHPGVSQVCVVEVVMVGADVVVTAPEVVVSSKHPHQPGVLHVSVLVRVFEVEDEVEVVVSELFDS